MLCFNKNSFGVSLVCLSSQNSLFKTKNRTQGFTLIELSVVMVIICILAIGVVQMYSNPTARVKGVMFNVLADLNLARSESVNRNRDVLVDFTLGDKDGYQICLDTDSDRDCDDESSKNVIKEVLFRDEVQFYDCTSAPPYPAFGPTKTPSGTELAGKNGLIFGGPDYIKWQPDGTSGDNGSIILYHPASGDPQQVKGDPYAAVISSAATGRIRLMRWRRGNGWSRK
ncbi:MAG: GspH/FimT family pseudopilin [Deltaproteobacteria bacterium]|jgi:prepilin-type N-terminal cleavage/methylation domain-containing protein|nr:GspH/FimT family pseudopilin [Deltaproteobacteria bacterium]